MLLILGMLPTFLYLVGIYYLVDAFTTMSRILSNLLGQVPLVPGMELTIPPEVTRIFGSVLVSVGAFQLAFILLIIIIGLTPAVIYLSVRRGTYRCPICRMPLT